MKLVVLGLSLSSAWGNGHATTYRALLKAFAARGHAVTFLERDVPWYRGPARDLPPELIPGYAVYLSFTGGPTLQRLERSFGSPAARALYCSVDEARYRPLGAGEGGGDTRWDLSYLGTYSPDRQPTLERLLLEPARRAPHLRFAVAGPQYPADIAWPENVERFEHVGPADHPAFYAASRWTLNVTRADMIAAGWSPSVRLFEAGACACPVVSDVWEGLDQLFAPGREIVLAEGAEAVLETLALPAARRDASAAAFRARVLAEHTAAHRAAELETALEESGGRRAAA